MLFNSYEFLFLYLPITLGGAFLFRGAARLWLTFASIVFFGYWDARAVPLLLLSIAFNYVVGTAIARAAGAGERRRAGMLLAFGVGLDLLVLGWFKYAGFFGTTLQALIGWPVEVPQVALPIGISFFTFTQIAFLVDARYRVVKTVRPLDYALFVSYFPHLVAGPIIHHAQVVPQFAKPSAFLASPRRLAVGGSIFAIGLFKKVIIADSLQPHVARVFDAASVQPDLVAAWIAALSYTFQLYFDFSGYSDMAIGLSCMLGIWLPLNFASPYKATSIIDFWRRWHMSLSQFLRDYLYIPLGGNRSGVGRYGNIMITMVLGGLWHGAAWTFVIWGALHGLFLVINHLWRSFRGPRRLSTPATRALAWAMTFGAVVVAWVFFRAAHVADAFAVLRGLAGANGVGSLALGGLPEAVGGLAARVVGLGPAAVGGANEAVVMILGGLFVCLVMPNTQEIMGRALRLRGEDVAAARAVAWGPRLAWAVGCGVMLALSLGGLIRSGEFMYFQF